MTSCVLRIAAVAGVLVAGPWSVHAQSTQPARNLKIDRYGNPVEWPVPDAVSKAPGTLHPTHAAVIAIMEDRRSLPVIDDRDRSSDRASIGQIVREPGVYNRLSKAQQAFLAQQRALGQWGPAQKRAEGGQVFHYATCVLFAVSEDDARQQAQALVSYLDRQAVEKLEATRRELAEANASVGTLTQRIGALKEKLAEINAKIESLHEKHGYAPSTDELRTFIQSAEQQMRTLEVESASQAARSHAIQMHISKLSDEFTAAQTRIQKRGPATQPASASDAMSQGIPGLLTSLQAALVNLHVDMVSAQARRQALHEQISQDKGYLSILLSRSAPSRELQDLQRQLSQRQQRVRELEERLTGLPLEYGPATVLDNTITIVPVKGAPQASQPAEQSGATR